MSRPGHALRSRATRARRAGLAAAGLLALAWGVLAVPSTPGVVASAGGVLAVVAALAVRAERFDEVVGLVRAGNHELDHGLVQDGLGHLQQAVRRAQPFTLRSVAVLIDLADAWAYAGRHDRAAVVLAGHEECALRLTADGTDDRPRRAALLASHAPTVSLVDRYAAATIVNEALADATAHQAPEEDVEFIHAMARAAGAVHRGG